jgi:hypothetical protein
MSNQERGDAERVIGAALSVPISMINALIDLLFLKGVISHDEVTHIFRAACFCPSGRRCRNAERILPSGNRTFANLVIVSFHTSRVRAVCAIPWRLKGCGDPVAGSRSLTAVGEAGFGHCSAETGGEAAPAVRRPDMVEA